MNALHYDEWQAWRDIVAEVERLTGKDFNGDELAPLVARLRRWGVLYYRLRADDNEKNN